MRYAALMRLSLLTGFALCAFSSQVEAGKIQVEAGGILQADGFNNSATPLNLGTSIVGATVTNSTTYRLKNQSPPVLGTPAGGTITSTPFATVSPSFFAGVANGAFTPFLTVGITTTAAGVRNGFITVVRTTAPNPGDLNDVIHVTGTVLDHANASFSSSSDIDSLVLDLGSFGVGGPPQIQPMSLTNLLGTPGYTAKLDLDSIVGFGDTGVLSTNAAPFSNLSPGFSSFFDIFFDLSTAGEFSANYLFNFTDENLPGELPQSLSLTIVGVVLPEPSTLSLLALGAIGITGYRIRRRRSGVAG